MKNEDDWKEQLDFSSTPKDDRDRVAYKRVYQALSQEPDFRVSSSFADGVMQRISMQQQKSNSRDLLYLVLGVFVLTLAAIVSVFLTGFKPHAGAFRFISGHYGLVIFGAAFVLFVHWLDKKIVRKSLSV